MMQLQTQLILFLESKHNQNQLQLHPQTIYTSMFRNNWGLMLKIMLSKNINNSLREINILKMKIIDWEINQNQIMTVSYMQKIRIYKIELIIFQMKTLT